MGDVLSRTLDGAGPIRTVSPSVVLRRWSGRADRASAEELGRRTGAGLVVYGAVVRRGPGLGDAPRRPARSGRRNGQDGHRGVRARRPGSASSPTPSESGCCGCSRRAGRSARSARTSIGSKSLPALKAFLQGEQFYRRGQWDSALTRYDQAIAADSTFALALAQMGTGARLEPADGGRVPAARRVQAAGDPSQSRAPPTGQSLHRRRTPSDLAAAGGDGPGRVCPAEIRRAGGGGGGGPTLPRRPHVLV